MSGFFIVEELKVYYKYRVLHLMGERSVTHTLSFGIKLSSWLVKVS